MVKEIIRTTGDVRRTLAQTMADIRSKDISASDAMAVAAQAKEITNLIQAEVNVMKAKLAMLNAGHDMGRLTQIGQMVIEDAGSVPTLSGASEQKED